MPGIGRDSGIPRRLTGTPLVWLHGEVKHLPFSPRARAKAGYSGY
jgi:hypothetical protein